MKFCRTIFLFLVKCFLIKLAHSIKFDLSSGNETSNLSNAIVVFIRKVFVGKQIAINVLQGTKDPKNFLVMDITDEITNEFAMQFKIPFRIETIYNLSYTLRRPKKCNLFMIETFEDFVAVIKFISPQKFQMSGVYLIVLISGKISEIEQVFTILWKLQIVNVNIIYERKDKRVAVVSYSPFNSIKCAVTRSVFVNEFVNGNFFYDVSQVYPDKLRNLYGCSIRVATSNNSVPYIFADKLDNGSYNLHGRDINLINSLAKALNFRIDYVFVGDEGFLNENGSANGPFAMLLEGRADLIIADYWLKINRLKFIDNTAPYISQQVAFVIPPGSELSSLEKFAKPLDLYSWCLLTLFVGAAVFVIYIVGKGSINLQDFIFGYGIRKPYINILVAIFGGSQKRIPQRNFARSLLMMFLMFCLVMRTLYTGSLYRFLQSKGYHREAQSIAEMIEKDFKFYTAPSIIDLVEGHERIYQRLLIQLVTTSDSFNQCFMYFLDMSFCQLHEELKYQIKYQQILTLKAHY